MSLRSFSSHAINDSTAIGRALLTAANVASERSLLELGPTDNVTFGSVTASFIGDGSLLNGLPNIFDQDLSTTNNVQFKETIVTQLNVRGTYTDAANYDRGYAKVESGYFRVGTEYAGTGAKLPAQFRAGNSILQIQYDGDVTLWRGGSTKLYMSASTTINYNATFRPDSNGVQNLGTASNQWGDVRSVLGTFTGAVTSTADSATVTHTFSNTGQVVANVTNTTTGNSLQMLNNGSTLRLYAVGASAALNIGTSATGALNLQVGGASKLVMTPTVLYPPTNNEMQLGYDNQQFLLARIGEIRFFNSYTDGSNFERSYIRHVSNRLTIGTESAGTGTDREIKLLVGSRFVKMTASGNLEVYYPETTTGYARLGSAYNALGLFVSGSDLNLFTTNSTYNINFRLGSTVYARIKETTFEPFTTDYGLGSDTKRWNVFGTDGDFSGVVTADSISAGAGDFTGLITGRTIDLTNGNNITVPSIYISNTGTGGSNAFVAATTNTSLGKFQLYYTSSGQPTFYIGSLNAARMIFRSNYTEDQGQIGQTFAGGFNVSATVHLSQFADTGNTGVGNFYWRKGSANGRPYDGTGLMLLQNNGNLEVYGSGLFTGALEMRNGNTATYMRAYNTYTDGANYERVELAWSANVFKIQAQRAGTGTLRSVEMSGSSLALKVGSSPSNGLLLTTGSVLSYLPVSPASSGIHLGTTTEPWRLYATNGDFAGKVDIVGSNGNQFRIGSTTSDATIQNAYMQARHYYAAEQDICMMINSSTAGSSSLKIGGGSSILNTVNYVSIFTASDNITTIGTEMLRVFATGASVYGDFNATGTAYATKYIIASANGRGFAANGNVAVNLDSMHFHAGYGIWARSAGSGTGQFGIDTILGDSAIYFGGVPLLHFAVNTVSQYNGTNAQANYVYNTFTDNSNYERAFMRWSSNVLQIGCENTGTGLARNVDIKSAGTTISIYPGALKRYEFATSIFKSMFQASLGYSDAPWGKLWSVDGRFTGAVQIDGLVGLNQVTPTAQLHVKANASNNNTAVFEYTGGSAAIKLLSNSGSHSKIYFGDTDAYLGQIYYRHISDELNFCAGTGSDTSSFRINNAGPNVPAGKSFLIYKLDTDASNFERGFMRFTSNVFEIGCEAAGTGTLRNMRLGTSGQTIDYLGSGSVTLSRAGWMFYVSASANGHMGVTVSNTSSGGRAYRLASYCAAGVPSFRIRDDSYGDMLIVDDARRAVWSKSVGEWNVTPPASQPAAIANPSDAATTQAAVISILNVLRNSGKIAA